MYFYETKKFGSKDINKTFFVFLEYGKDLLENYLISELSHPSFYTSYSNVRINKRSDHPGSIEIQL